MPGRFVTVVAPAVASLFVPLRASASALPFHDGAARRRPAHLNAQRRSTCGAARVHSRHRLLSGRASQLSGPSESNHWGAILVANDAPGPVTEIGIVPDPNFEPTTSLSSGWASRGSVPVAGGKVHNHLRRSFPDHKQTSSPSRYGYMAYIVETDGSSTMRASTATTF